MKFFKFSAILLACAFFAACTPPEPVNERETPTPSNLDSSPSPNASPAADSMFHVGESVLFKADQSLKGVVIKVELRGKAYRYTVKWAHPGNNRNLFTEEYALYYELVPAPTPVPTPTPLFGSTPLFSSPSPSSSR